MRFLKMGWVKVLGLILVGLVLAVLIYVLVGRSVVDSEKDFLSDTSKRMRWEGCGDYKDILYQRNVKWSGFQDGSGPMLDEDNLIVFAKSEFNVYNVCQQWKLGQTVVLAYSRAEGAFLVDPNNGRHLRLLKVLKNHPIDEYIKHEFDKPDSCTTTGMVFIYDRGVDLWKLELQRLDEDILSRKYFKGEIRRNYLKLQKARNEYMKLMSHTIGQATYFSPNGGTIRRINSTSKRSSIVRDLALQAMEIAEFVDDFDSPGNDSPVRVDHEQ